MLYISVGQRYSVMIKLNQPIGNYYLRFATHPSGDMQQVLEGQAVVAYIVGFLPETSAKFQVEADILDKTNDLHRHKKHSR